MTPRERIIFIDPSINNVGIAIFDRVAWNINNKAGLVTWDTFHPKPGSVPYRVSQIAAHITALAFEWECVQMVIEELPAYTRGGKNTGSLLKLARVVGALEALGIAAEEYTWKGKEAKEDTDHLVKWLYPQLYDQRTSNHARDAVLMGHRWLSERNMRVNEKEER